MAEIKQGYLYKQGGMIKTWKKRWFALTEQRTFQYYEDKATADRCGCDGTLAIDSINLDAAKLTLYKTQDVSRPYTLGIQPAGVKRNYLITTDSASSLKDWVAALLDSGCVYAVGSPNVSEIQTDEDEKVSQYSTLEGWLWKQGGRIKTWRLRYFVLENGLLHYYKGVSPEAQKSAIRSLSLADAQVHHLSISESQQHVVGLPKGSVLTGVASAIRLIPPPNLNLRNFLFVAHNEAAASLWVDKIQRSINGNDREEGEEDEVQKLDSFMEPKGGPTPEPTPVKPLEIIQEQPIIDFIPIPEPVAPKRPEKPKKPSRELTQENTKIMFSVLDRLYNNMAPDLSKYSQEVCDDLNAQLLGLGLAPLGEMVQGMQPVALHSTLTANNQPLLSTPALTSNLGVTSGWLLRQQDNGEWKLRWCVINRGTKALRYWTSPADLRAHAKPLKTISLLDCKWKSSNDESCDVVTALDCKSQSNDDVFLTIKPVNAFGASKAQQSKLGESAVGGPASGVDDAGKKKNEKKLIPLLFAAPNNALRDKWLEAIKDASKDLDTEDDDLPVTETGDVPITPKPRSLTGRLSVFAQGLVGGGKKEEKKPEPPKPTEPIVVEGNEDGDDEVDVKFANTSILQQQIQREEHTKNNDQHKAQMLQRQSVIGEVRRMPIDSDSDSDGDIPLPPPPRKPTVQSSPHAPTRPNRPTISISPQEQIQLQEQRRQDELRRQQEEMQRRQQEEAAANEPFDEDSLREEIENEIITWIKQCDISYPLMLTSLTSLFPMFRACPTFPNVQHYVSRMDPVDYVQIPLQILKDALLEAFHFLNPDNIVQLIQGLNLKTNIEKQRILITAEMCAEALESAYDDFKEQFE